MASAFADVQSAPPIEVFQLGRDFAADTNPKKVRRWMSFLLQETDFHSWKLGDLTSPHLTKPLYPNLCNFSKALK